jgi:hypothetical protein
LRKHAQDFQLARTELIEEGRTFLAPSVLLVYRQQALDQRFVLLFTLA